MKKNPKAPYLSVVVPFFNEEDSVEELHRRLTEVLKKTGKSYELIFVDDGSRDRTPERLAALHRRDPRLHVIRLKRNFGQTAGLQAGFDFSRGEIVVSMDGDLQHDPAEIPRFLEKIDEGYDIVSGWRKKRVDNPVLRKAPSWAANRMMRSLSGVPIHDFGTTFKAYRREVLKDLRLYGELHRFIPALISRTGVKIVEIPITNIVRPKGKSKYGLSRVRRVFFDLLTVKFLISFIDRPLQLFGLVGLFLGGMGFSLALLLTAGHYFFGWPIRDNQGNLILAVLLMIVGLQLVLTGLLAEVISRIYFATHRIRIYHVEGVLSRRPAAGGPEA
ncbi:MAG: glycosyltransferase family 2 protein [Candidatus Aminicenantes bacterium]|nr:glycosyltransferase family 2 protein [Candidatus Aminicenantes bacterium]